MNIKEYFQNKKETKAVGSFECTEDTLKSSFLNLMEYMNMTNPPKLYVSSGKAITIKRKKDKYIITLNSYNPPIRIEWSELRSFDEFEATINQIIDLRKKVAFVNTINSSQGSQFQLAFA